MLKGGSQVGLNLVTLISNSENLHGQSSVNDQLANFKLRNILASCTLLNTVWNAFLSGTLVLEKDTDIQQLND